MITGLRRSHLNDKAGLGNKMNMSKPILIFVVVVTLMSSIRGWKSAYPGSVSSAANEETESSPFQLAVVPTTSYDEPIGRHIAMAKSSPGAFYVILTNTSKKPQAAFEGWNSWGYQAISFEIRSAGGLKATITRKEQRFDKNFPSTFIIPPGESMVYPISLDAGWKALPSLPIADQTPMAIVLKAIYRVDPTPAAIKGTVWTGRVESKEYHFELRHW